MNGKRVLDLLGKETLIERRDENGLMYSIEKLK